MEDDTLTEVSKNEAAPTEEENSVDTQQPSDGEKSVIPCEKDDEELMRTTKEQVGEAREENQRLKTMLANIVKEYQSLQNSIFKIMQQEKIDDEELKKLLPNQFKADDSEFVSLSLGVSNSIKKTSGKGSSDEKEEANLSLGLECKLEADSSMAAKSPSSQTSFGENKDDEAAETWPPSKTAKNPRGSSDEVVLQQPQAKKARVSVRARCDTPTMHDGCQWRKYGQKIAKGNPCPRAYYRCTISPNCPVRKQVQRCVEDMSILITTYEGTHNHPLPLSATAMASTTSAAVSMLSSRSSTSQQVGSLGASLSAPISSGGLHFSLPQNTLRPHQFPFQTTSISTYNSHPTITLDLTNPNGVSTNIFGNRVPSPSTSLFSQSCLNFVPPAANVPPSNPWNASFSPFPSVVHKPPPFPEFPFQPAVQSADPSQPAISTEAITAATKILIASNPTLRNALAAAISSLAGDANAVTRENSLTTNAPGIGDHAAGINLKAGQSFGYGQSLSLTLPSAQNGTVACGSSYLKPSQNNQQSSLPLFPLMPHSSSRSGSAGSSSDSKEHVK